MPLYILAGIAGFVWLISLSALVRRGSISRYRLLQVALWVTVLSGSAITVLRRVALHAEASAVVAASTGLLLFVGAVAFLAHRRGGGGRNLALLVVSVLLLATELVYLFVAGGPISDHFQEISALAFLPLFIYLVYQSGASAEQLLRLAGTAAVFVVVGSVILGFMGADLAYSHNFSDVRRISLPGVPWRLGGFAPHPNLLSVTALFAIILAFANRFRWRWPILVVSLVALAMAESRVAIVSLGIIAIVAWIFRGGSALGRAILSLPAIAVLAFFIIDAIPSDDAGVLTADVTTNGRFRIWDLVSQQFLANPLEGFGPLAFQPDSGSPYLAAGLLHAHNQIFQAIAETGLIGGTLTVALFIIFAALAFKRPIRPVYPALAAAFFASSPTEPFLSLHLFGMNYNVVPALLFLTAIMSSAVRTETVISSLPGTGQLRQPPRSSTPTTRLAPLTRVGPGTIG